MESTSSRIAVGAAIVIVVALIGYFIWHNTEATPDELDQETHATSTDEQVGSVQENTASSTGTPPRMSGDTMGTLNVPIPEDGISRVQLALLDTRGVTNGTQRGCDRVVLVPYRIGTVEPTVDRAMQALFSWDEEMVGSWLNFIARANQTLKYERTTIENGTAHIYLTGSLSGIAGTCDNLRAETQIQETALQFPEVQRVQIYLNGTPTDVPVTE